MIAIACNHENTKKHGHDRNGNPRTRCKKCGKTWIEDKPRLFGNMRIPKDKAIMALKMLLDGMSIRAVERIIGIHRDTILRLLELVGQRACEYWRTHMRSLPAENVQADETWGFVACKEKTRSCQRRTGASGDAYTFLAIERDTKLVLAWHIGRRGGEDTMWFADKLSAATSGRFQLSTDGFYPYRRAIPLAFAGDIDFAQLIKIYGKSKDVKAETRYSPAEIREIRKEARWGSPDMDAVCTSHIERQNLNIRMGIRRMTRLTNAFSKKWQNHEYHMAFYLLYYNFCRVHMTLKTTPAVKAGIVEEVWSLEKMLEEIASATHS